MLTPRQTVLATRDKSFKSGAEPVVILLEEKVRCVDAAGRECTAFHQIALACDDDGAARLAKLTRAFRKSNQKMFLVSACSIQPGGEVQQVADQAAFFQATQRESDVSLYSDYTELTVLFPSMRSGTIREMVIVIEDQTSIVPGEFTGVLAMAGPAPIGRMRNLIELEEPLARRLKITDLGQTPAPARQALDKGRLRLTWSADHVPALTPELEPRSSDADGASHISIDHPGLEGVCELVLLAPAGTHAGPPGASARIAELTGTLHDRDAIIAALFREAANEVRVHRTGIRHRRLSALRP